MKVSADFIRGTVFEALALVSELPRAERDAVIADVERALLAHGGVLATARGRLDNWDWQGLANDARGSRDDVDLSSVAQAFDDAASLADAMVELEKGVDE